MSYVRAQSCCLGSAYRPQNYQKINSKNYKNRHRAKPLILFLFNFFIILSVATIPLSYGINSFNSYNSLL